MRNKPGSVEDYTTAFLIISGGILFMAFFTLAAMKGFIWVAITAALLDVALKIGAARSGAGQISQDA